MIKSKGVTLVEMLVVVAIVGILAVAFLFYFNSSRRQTELSNEALKLASVIRLSKQKTLSSENLASWGVHLNQDSYILFEGDDFATSTNQTTYNLPLNMYLVHNFAPLSDIIFAKVSGNPNQTGTITIYLTNTSSQKTICLNSIGTVETNCSALPSAPEASNTDFPGG